MEGMNTLVARCADLTAYPALFGDVYWGRGPADDDDVTPEIIQNRNQFADLFALRRTRATIPHYQRLFDETELDHVELYRGAGTSYVFIVSNYDYPPPPILKMRKYEPLYSRYCDTYIRQFATLSEFKDTLRSFGRR